jgi:hypothetical protein
VSSLNQIRSLIPLGPEGEELRVSSNIETDTNKFGDTVHAFQVSNSDGSTRYRVVLTIASLRPALRAVKKDLDSNRLL